MSMCMGQAIVRWMFFGEKVDYMCKARTCNWMLIKLPASPILGHEPSWFIGAGSRGAEWHRHRAAELAGRWDTACETLTGVTRPT